MTNGERYLVIDIETAGLDSSDLEIQKYLIEKNIVPALHPFFSKVIAIGLKKSGEEPVILHGDDEAKILKEFCPSEAIHWTRGRSDGGSPKQVSALQ